MSELLTNTYKHLSLRPFGRFIKGNVLISLIVIVCISRVVSLISSFSRLHFPFVSLSLSLLVGLSTLFGHLVLYTGNSTAT